MADLPAYKAPANAATAVDYDLGAVKSSGNAYSYQVVKTTKIQRSPRSYPVVPSERTVVHD